MESIGQKLKEAREAKGLSLEEIAKMTKIPQLSLQLLEAGRFQDLPAPTYIKGFLKLYAQSVGLDVQGILEEFQKGEMSQTKQILILQGEKVHQMDYWALFVQFASQGWAFALVLLRRVHPKVWMALGGVLLLGIILSQLFGSKTPVKKIQKEVLVNHPSTPLNSSLVIPNATPQTHVVQPQSSAPNFGSRETSDQGYSLVLVGEVKATVWLRVHCDDRLVFEGTLKKGGRETWQAKEYFKLRIGNPDAIKFTLNNKELGRVGPNGRIKDIRLTKEGWYVYE